MAGRHPEDLIRNYILDYFLIHSIIRIRIIIIFNVLYGQWPSYLLLKIVYTNKNIYHM